MRPRKASARYPDNKTCFICAIRPVMFVAWINTFTATYFCAHTRPSSYPHFQKLNFLSGLALFSSVILTISLGITIAKLHRLKFNDLLLSIMMVQTTLITIIITVSLQINMNLQINHLHGLIYIVENRRKYGIHEFFDKQFQRDIYKMLLQFCLPYVFLTVVILGSSLYNFQNLDEDLILKIITLLINIFSNLSNFLVTICFTDIYVILFQKCYQKIVATLMKHRDDQPKVKINFPLRKKLQILQSLHSDIFANFQSLPRLFSSKLLLFWIGFCTILVGNFFLIVKCFKEQRPHTDEEILSFVLYITAFMGSSVFFQKLQKLHDGVSNFV